MSEEPSNQGLMLSARQQRTVAAGITVFCAALVIGFILGLLWLLVRFLDYFSGVFFPLVAALILALVFKPQYNFFHEKLKLPPVLSVLVLYLSIAVPVSVFIVIFGAEVYGQAVDLLANLPQVIQSIHADIRERWPDLQELVARYGLTERLAGSLEGKENVLVAGVQQLVTRIFSTVNSAVGFFSGLLGLVILPVYLAFFLMAPTIRVEKLNEQLPFLKEKTRKHFIYLIDQFLQIMVTFFRGQIVIAVLQGILYAVGFAAVGLKYGFVIGFTLGILNIVPYLGSMIGLAVALPTAYLQTGGGLPLLLMVSAIFVVVQCIEAYILTPKIMGDRTGLHPVVIMFAIFFWGTALSGLAGMILAIPLTAFFVVFWRLARDRYVYAVV